MKLSIVKVKQKMERMKQKRTKRVHFSVGLLLGLLIVACLVSGAALWRYLNQEDAQHSKATVYARPATIPDYSGLDYIELNDGKPDFNEFDLTHMEGEHYSQLDALGRCGAAWARLHKSLFPTEERGAIGQIKPSGWVQAKYPGVVESNPPYLYNRCHLIAYMFTGQNANEKNLITGTRYMNVSVMLPWEEKVVKYLERTDNHVLYRVTPYFKDRELVARGLEMEAYSVEDGGEGICFHVFIYNQQPGVKIDYQSGRSRVS